MAAHEEIKFSCGRPSYQPLWLLFFLQEDVTMATVKTGCETTVAKKLAVLSSKEV